MNCAIRLLSSLKTLNNRQGNAGNLACKQLESGFVAFLDCVLTYLYSCQVAEVTFNFWYRLSEALFKGEDEAKTALFRPYFESLFEALCVHCRLETDAVRILLC